MDIHAEVTNLIYAIKQIEEQAKPLKSAFEAYIKDRSIPVLTRFELWDAAPSVLKNNNGSVEHLKYAGEEICWCDDYNYDRTATVNLTAVIYTMLETLEGYNSSTENKKGWYHIGHKIPTEQDVYQFIEDVLEKNLESFVNDW